MRKIFGSVILVAVLATTLTSTATAQKRSWQHRWFWGASGGAYIFETATQGTDAAATVGGHWMITGKRSALYLGFDQIIFSSNTTAAIPDATDPSGLRTVTFDSGRRIQALLYAIPSDTKLQIYLGAGFAIHQITDAQAVAATVQEAQSFQSRIDDVSTKAFAILSGGFQLRSGRWALFGQYQYSPSSDDFLITSEQHAFSGGLRFSLTSAHEVISTDR